jgi:hypothetical protein
VCLVRAETIMRIPEQFIKDTPAWYAATRARVEACAALEQAEELKRVLDSLGKRLGK